MEQGKVRGAVLFDKQIYWKVFSVTQHKPVYEIIRWCNKNLRSENTTNSQESKTWVY